MGDYRQRAVNTLNQAIDVTRPSLAENGDTHHRDYR
jgi:hypothetical protein